MKYFKNKIIKQIIPIIVLKIAFLAPRGFEIGKFVAVDEVNWLHRSGIFYDAIVRNDWGDTYINNSPGVITTWVGALAFRIAAPSYKLSQDINTSQVTRKSSYTTFQNDLVWKVGVQPLFVLAISRIIMILLLTAVLLASYYYAQRLFGVWPSLIGFLIISLDPFFIATYKNEPPRCTPGHVPVSIYSGRIQNQGRTRTRWKSVAGTDLRAALEKRN